MKCDDIQLTILTCEKRYSSVGKTLQSVLESDFRGEILVINDKRYTSSEDIPQRLNDAVRGIYTDFYATGKEFLLYLEDDTIVNKHIQYNLLKKINTEDVSCIVLCNWGDMQSGAQGLLLHRDLVKQMLDIEWLKLFDGVLYDLIDKQKIPLLKYSPALVQHNEGDSAVTGMPTPYYAVDFDPDFKDNV